MGNLFSVQVLVRVGLLPRVPACLKNGWTGNIFCGFDFLGFTAINFLLTAKTEKLIKVCIR